MDDILPPPNSPPPLRNKIGGQSSSRGIQNVEDIIPPSRPPPGSRLSSVDTLPPPPDHEPPEMPRTVLPIPTPEVKKATPAAAPVPTYLEGLLSKKGKLTWSGEKFVTYDALTMNLVIYKGKEKTDPPEETVVLSKDASATVVSVDGTFKEKTTFSIVNKELKYLFSCTMNGVIDGAKWVETINKSIEEAAIKQRREEAAASIAKNKGSVVVFGLGGAPSPVISPPTTGESEFPDDSTPAEAFVNPFDSGGGMTFDLAAMMQAGKKEKKSTKKKDSKSSSTKVTSSGTKGAKAPVPEEDDTTPTPSESKPTPVVQDDDNIKKKSETTTTVSSTSTSSGTIIDVDISQIAGTLVRVLYEFTATPGLNQMTVREGQVVKQIRQYDDGWTFVVDMETLSTGNIPSSYIDSTYTVPEAGGSKSPAGGDGHKEGSVVKTISATVLYNFTADTSYAGSDQVSVTAGEIVEIEEVLGDGWTSVIKQDKVKGSVPSTYLDTSSKPLVTVTPSPDASESKPKASKLSQRLNKLNKLSTVPTSKPKGDIEGVITEEVNEVDASRENRSVSSSSSFHFPLDISPLDGGITPELVVRQPLRGKRNSFFGGIPSNIAMEANSAVQRLSSPKRASMELAPSPQASEDTKWTDVVPAATAATNEDKLRQKQRNLWRIQNRLRLQGDVPLIHLLRDSPSLESDPSLVLDASDSLILNTKGSAGGYATSSSFTDHPTSTTSSRSNNSSLPSHDVLDDHLEGIEAFLGINDVNTKLKVFDYDAFNSVSDDASSGVDERIINNADLITSQNERILMYLRVRTMAEYCRKQLLNKRLVVSLFSALEDKESKEMVIINENIRKLSMARQQLREEKSKLDKAVEETEAWHLAKMKELADIAKKLEERHLIASKVLNAASVTTTSARIDTLRKRAHHLEGVLAAKEKELAELK